ncbi:retrovirus-related Pol polyprotein from transposon TNT 1-94 [Trichonephila clavipes]|nr:retrovirus-related Pol polyprotein from transposon TNT 1-94 [Trichonephila clavipes]
MDEILQILREEEATLNLPIKTRMDSINSEAFYYTYLANSGIFHEKTIPYNSESNGKAERADRVLLERARSLLYESKLPLKFWAEAINCSTQVSNVTPRKGKEKIPLEIWTGNKPKLNYLKKFGCVAYFHVPKVLRNKFEVPGRRGIMLGYARERRGYRIYDIKNQKVIEERSVKFNEYLKGSNYLGEIENETWDIDSFFEVSPERNKINQNTENGVLYNFDINNGPGAILRMITQFPPSDHVITSDRQNPNSGT